MHMSTTSSDLSAILSRMRKPVSPEVAPEVPATAEPTPEALQNLQQSAHDLAEIQAELVADETLLLRILGMLYMSKKRNIVGYAISIIDVEKRMGLPREGATFVCDYMKYKKLVLADDKSRFTITVEGIDYLRRGLGVQQAAGE
jgi:hypothetical protein